MKTSNYLIALAALTSFTFVSCSDNDFLGSASNIFSGGKEEITFGSGTKNLTRAGENLQHAKAAEKLNNHFVLYGFKYNPEELAAVTNDELVFDHYNLYYQEGTENTTESNTAGWEYVGYQTTASQDQSIKYWDHSAAGYVFSAISSLDATATKIAGATTTKYDKGWTVSIPAGGTLNGLYASDRVEKLLATDYDKEVMLTFYSVVTKVRFAFYEIIPGYKVHIDKFYYGSTGTTTNFAIDGNFRGLKTDDATELTVTYYSNTDVDGIENRPKITYDDDEVNQETSKTFGTNIQATAAIGTSSPEATYDQYGGEYTCILPYKSGNLSLKVDYTLTSIDGSGETIEVKGATAVVPEIYTNWKENFAYTYLFKISDNSNGYTGTDGVRGLYPITFDACVINEEDGIQETITSIAEPSFTTYQNGVIVTENDEYIEGKVADNNTNIYYTVMLNGAAQALNANTKVYEVNNYGTETLTENVVENWKNNYCVLTEVTPTAATTIPMKNGANLTPAANTAYYFTPKAGKNYVIQYKVTDNIAYATLDEYKAMTGNSTATEIPTGQYKVKAGDYYKLIRVVGDPAAITYALTADAGQKITTQVGTVTYTLKSNSPAADAVVLGAADIIKIKKGEEDATAKFNITDNENGTYTIKATADAIKEGLDDTYSVAVVKKDGTVGSAATIDDADNTFAVDMASELSATVVAGNKVEITPSIGGASVSGAAITDISNNKITIVEKAGTPGTYVISAASDLAAGTGYSAKIAGETVAITVNSYAFDPTSYTFDWYEGVDAATIKTDIALKMNSSLAENIASDVITGTGIATIAKKGDALDGNYRLTPVSGGKTTLKYQNATLDVTVNKYALVCEGVAADAKVITALTGSAKLIYTINDKEQVVKTSDIVVTYSANGTDDYAAATGKTYSLVNNGKYFTFGNVVTPGYYKFQYKKSSDVVGSEIIKVE